MVVTCEKCHTKFVLDETRIKGARTQARCSRCQNVFWVEREEEPVDAAPPEVEEAGAGMEAEDFPLAAEAEETGNPEEAEAEAPPPREAAPAEMPKPSAYFKPPAKRSLWLWIIALIGGLVGGALLGVAVMWFWGYGWVSQHFPGQVPPAATAAKVARSPKVAIVPPPAAPPAPVQDLKDLEITNQEERYKGLVNSKGGQLLLIQGKVKNASKQFRGPIKIKAMLTDPQQKVVKERQFFAGTVIFDDELQSLDPEEINRWLDTPGGRAQKQIIEPGESQSFMVVFFGAPKNLSGYGYKMQVVKGPVVPGPARSE